MDKFKAQITRKEAEKFRPLSCGISEEPYNKGNHIAFNKGAYGWNWDLILYRGKYYVAGYRNFPKTFGKYKG